MIYKMLWIVLFLLPLNGFNYLEKRPYNNIHQNAKQDADYLETTIQEKKHLAQYKQPDLSDAQGKIIMQ